jgi:hypothetical protein
MPPFPYQLGPLRAVFPSVFSTMKALRRLRRIRDHLLIRSPAPTLASSFIPRQRRQPQGMATFITPRASGPLRVGQLTGAPRFLGNPSCTYAPVSDPGRVGMASPLTGHPILSPLRATMRTPTMRSISWLNNAASVLAVYASSSALLHSHARLASGWWLAFAGRDSNPLNSTERFQFNFNFLLSQVYPGATPLRSRTAGFPRSGSDLGLSCAGLPEPQ